MKKLIFLIFVISSWNIFHAQENKSFYQKKIDSIQTVLNTQLQDDTIKVQRLNNLAHYCFLDLQYKKGLIAATQARQIAKSLQYKRGEGMYFQTLSALNTFSNLSIYYDKKAKWSGVGINTEDSFNFQIYFFDVAILEKAITRLNEALDFFQKTQDKEATAQILYNIGLISLWINKPNEAIIFLERSFELFQEINQPVPAAIVLELKMSGLQIIGKTKEADEVENDLNKIISGLNDARESAFLTYIISQYYFYLGNKTLAFEKELKVVDELERIGEKYLRIIVLEDLAVNFQFQAITEKAIEYYKKAILLREEIGYFDDAIRIYFNTGFELVALKKYDEAKIFFSKAKDLSYQEKDPDLREANIQRYSDAMGQILMGQEQYQEALSIFNQAEYPGEDNFYLDFYRANCYYKLGDLNKAISFGQKSYESSLHDVDERLKIKICLLLSEVYDQVGQPIKAFEFLKKYRSFIKNQEEQDIANHTANLEIQSIIANSLREKDLLEKEKLLKEKQNQNQRWWLFSIAAGLFSSFVVVFLLMKNNKNKQKANLQLQIQKEEINHQKEKAEIALTNLISTQAQLIQSEKMASLGQLTAGIAHEIQNPLNFVNNFSEVSAELVDEIKDIRRKKQDRQTESEEDEILEDIKQNLEKINHHGKRADAIVKGMLEHSRASSGEKVLIDINALADEYLRLSYHGMRAK